MDQSASSLRLLFTFSILSVFLSTASVFGAPRLKEEYVTYTANGVTMKGYVVYDQDKKGKRPGVLVVPEWWGFNDYVRMRARELAGLGYIAMAVDMYGNGKIAANPQEAQELSAPFYKDPELGKVRLDAAIQKIRQYPETDHANIAAMGYCFGGGVVLNSACLGADLKGVVSFHGSLGGIQAPKNRLKARILVCHGADDKFVSQKDVSEFKHKMDSIGARYTVKVYPGATHAFTNPAATQVGKQFNMPIAYNEAADKHSWQDMKAFFQQLFH